MTVRLRGLLPRDDEALWTLFADADTARWNPGVDERDIPAWRMRGDEAPELARTWAVTGESDELLGTVSVFGVDAHRRVGEIGFRTVPAARGRGLARAAVELAIAEASASLPVDRLVLFHAVDNTPSCRVALACGFELDATLPANFRYGDGKLHDEHRHLRTVRTGFDAGS